MSDSDDDGDREIQPTLRIGYDKYRSVADSNILILVASDIVPPFRFKAGGWELLEASIELGSAMKARIAEKGFLMLRLNEDRTGAIELTNFPPPLAEWNRSRKR